MEEIVGKDECVDTDVTRLLNFFEDAWGDFVSREESVVAAAGLGADVTGDVVEFIARRGKRLRPVLFLAAWEAMTGRRVSEGEPECVRLRDVAVALELVHAFVLVHDDVIDRSRTRRGRPTLHRLIEERLGVDDEGQGAYSMAVVLGDVLFARALRLMVSATEGSLCCGVLLPLFLDVVRDTGLGELRDIFMAGSDVSEFAVADVERMYYLKTTRYTIELPLAAGFLMGGGDVRHLSALAQYAQGVGLAFQIMNDLRELQSAGWDEDEPEGDILEAKKTWLLVKTRELLSEADRAFFDMCLAEHPRDGRFVFKVRHLIDKARAGEHAAAYISQLVADAETALEAAEMPPEMAKKVIGLGRDLKSLMFC